MDGQHVGTFRCKETVMAGRIHIDLFTTLDGVARLPVAPTKTPPVASLSAAGRRP
ncbi:hypothetical protein [Cryobacterium sp. TMT1-66-1]|uniref:hypothetical protein n=1 Tax=unclassified Cryobacterium TaxID=2649013 RepID=UPI00351A73AE